MKSGKKPTSASKPLPSQKEETFEKLTAEQEKMKHLIKPCDLKRPFALVSYKREDWKTVWRDVLRLQEWGYNLWIDIKHVHPGQVTWRHAENAIRSPNCLAVLYYVSENSLCSKPCYRELSAAHAVIQDGRKKGFAIVPFAVCPIPSRSITKLRDRIDQQMLARIEAHPNDSAYIDFCNGQRFVAKDIVEDIFRNSTDRPIGQSMAEHASEEDYYKDLCHALPKKIRKKDIALPFAAGWWKKAAACVAVAAIVGLLGFFLLTRTTTTDIFVEGTAIGTYTGRLNGGGQMDGAGTLALKDGALVEGQWEDGRLRELLSYTFSDGSRYTGELAEDYRPDGAGQIIWETTGSSYQGEWENGVVSGIGTYSSTVGISDDTQQVYAWTFGKEYEGPVIGTYLPDHKILFYTGMCRNGLPHGYGVLSDKTNLLVLEGEFFEGKLHGAVNIRYANGNTRTTQASQGSLPLPEEQTICFVEYKGKTLGASTITVPEQEHAAISLKDKTEDVEYTFHAGDTLTFTYSSAGADMERVGYYFSSDTQIVDIYDGEIIGKNMYGQNLYRASIQLPEMDGGKTHTIYIEAIAVNDVGKSTNTTKTGWYGYTFRMEPRPAE